MPDSGQIQPAGGEAAHIMVPKWMLILIVPAVAAALGAFAADIRMQDRIEQAATDDAELRKSLEQHMAADDMRHAASQEHRFKMSQQIQWLCVQRERDNARAGAENAGQCP